MSMTYLTIIISIAGIIICQLKFFPQDVTLYLRIFSCTLFVLSITNITQLAFKLNFISSLFISISILSIIALIISLIKKIC